MASPRFDVMDGEIVDLQTRQIISPNQFNSLATPEDRDVIEEQLGGLLESGPSEDGSDETDQPTQEFLPSESAAPSPAKPTFDEFMTAAREDNPGVPDRQLRQHWAKHYSDIDPKTLPALDAFMQAAKEDNPGVSPGKLRKHWEEHYGDFGAMRETPPERDFMRGAETAVKQLPQLAYGLEAGAGAVGEKILGEGGMSTAVKEHGVKKFDEASKGIEKDSRPSDSATTAWEMATKGNPGALVDFIQYGLGYMAVQGVEMVATGGVGYAVGKLGAQGAAKLIAGKMVAKEAAKLAAGRAVTEAVTKQAVANVAGKIGQTTALAATAVGMEGGEIFGDLTSEAGKEGRQLSGEELAKAFGATVGAGALEFVGDKIGFDLIMGKGIGRMAGEATGLKGRAARGLLQGGAGAVAEGGTEFGQTLIEEAGKGKDPFSEASIREAVDSAALGAVGGTAIGAGSGVLRGAKPIDDTSERLLNEPETDSIKSSVPEASTIDDILSAPDIDTAIAHAQDMVQRSAYLETDESALLESRTPLEPLAPINEPERTRQPFDVPILSPGQQETPTIEPGQAFTPRQEPEADPRAAIADERNRLIAMRDSTNNSRGTAEAPLEVPIQVTDRRGIQAPVDQLGTQPIIPPVATSEPVENKGNNSGDELLGLDKQENAPLEERGKIEQDQKPSRKYFPKEQKPTVYTLNPVEKTDAPVTANPSVQDLHALAAQKGFNIEGTVFRELTRLSTGRKHLDDLTPKQRLKFANVLRDIPEKAYPSLPAKSKEKTEAVPLPTGQKEPVEAPATNGVQKERDRLLARGRNGAPGPSSLNVEGGITKSTRIESAPNTAVTDTQILSDLVIREPFKSKGFRGLDVPTQRIVMARVFGMAQDLKVREAIIRSLPVDMVNQLRRQKLTPEMLFHDEAVFSKAFISNAYVPVSIRFKAADTAIHSAARSTTTLGEASGLGTVASEPPSTVTASERDRLSLAETPTPKTTKLDGPPLTGKASSEDRAASDTSKARHDVAPSSDVVLGAGAAETASVPPTVPKPTQDSNKKTSVRTDSKPSESYRLLPSKTRESFEASLVGAERGDRPLIRTLKEWLDPANKTLRAEFERRSGVKLPNGLAATNAAVEEYFKKPSEPVIPKEDSGSTDTKETEYEFSSVQINLPSSVAKEIDRISAQIPDADLAEDGREDQPHITVKYELHANDVNDVRSILSGQEPVTVTVGKLSVFPATDERASDVLKLNVESPGLHGMNQEIANRAETTETQDEYRPHITVAYLKPGRGEKYARLSNPLLGDTFTIDQVVFSDKQGQQVPIRLEGQPAEPLQSDAFSLTNQAETKPKAKGPEQLSIDVPAPTVGEAPIIGREVQPEEAPLFSKEAQTQEAEQTALPDSASVKQKEPWQMTSLEYARANVPESIRDKITKPQKSFEAQHRVEIKAAIAAGKPVPAEVLADYPDLQPQTAPEAPTTILANALRQAADQIEGKPVIQDVGEKIGGARKDMAEKTGPTGPAKPKDSTPGWRKRYAVSQIVGSKVPSEEGKWTIRDTKQTDFMGRPRQATRTLFDTKEEAESRIPLLAVSRNHRTYKNREGEWEIDRKIGDRNLVKVVKETFPTEEAAMRYMIEHAEEIIETKTNFGEEILPRPETVRRVGADRRNGKNVVAEDFRKTFDFRAVEFGNWNNQDERQEVMNHAYDGLMDLAEVLDIPLKAIGLNGELALAFGARGHGLTGARAHYERDYGVINLTKMKGAGSLAHEWFHATDHYFGRQDGKTKSTKTTNSRGDQVYDVGTDRSKDYASFGFKRDNSGVRQEVRDAYTKLLNTMFTKAEQYVEDAAKVEKFVGETREGVENKLKDIRDNGYNGLSKTLDPKYYKRGNKPATAEQLSAFDEIAKEILSGVFPPMQFKVGDAGKLKRMQMSGRWSNESLDKISAIFKAVRGRSGFGSGDIKGPLDDLRTHMNVYSARLKMLAEAQAGKEKTKKIPTEFAREAKSIDQGRNESYWMTEHEMAARAFEAYVEDKVMERGGQSDFLIYGTDSVVETPWGWKRPYPAGDERKAINKEFATLFETLDTKETDQGTALFDEREEMSDEEKEDLSQRLYEGLQNGPRMPDTALRMVDSTGMVSTDTLQKLAAGGHTKKLSRMLEEATKQFAGHLSLRIPKFKLAAMKGFSVDYRYYGANQGGSLVYNPYIAMQDILEDIEAGRKTADDMPEFTGDLLVKTMVHELTHQQIGSHGEQFRAQELANRAILSPLLSSWTTRLTSFLKGTTNERPIDAFVRDTRAIEASFEGGIPLRDRYSNDGGMRDTYLERRGPEQRGRGESDSRGSTREGTRPRTDLSLRRESQQRDHQTDSGLGESEAGSDRASHGINPTTARERLSAAKTSARPYLLGALGLQQIADVYGRDHYEVADYNSALQTMQADFVQTTQTSDKILKDWDKLKVPVADQMAKVMEDARFANFDPDPSRQQAAITPAQVELKKRFKELPDEAKAVYRAARDFYTKMAQDRFDAIRDRINRSGATLENRKRMIDRMQLVYEKTKSKVYFPFTRFGDHVVKAVKMENGKEVREQREVLTFDSPADANKFAMLMRARGYKVKQTTKKGYSQDRDAGASTAVREMMDIIEEIPEQQLGIPGVLSNKRQLLEALDQTFLQALPDMSYAKHFIHAKEVKGASRDALRSFAHSALHGAHHISRIRYADRLSNAVMALDERINETEEGDVTEARQVYNELVQRHNTILNPNTHPFSAWLGQLGFTMSLGGVVATGVTNMTQVPLITLPWLGARYGFGKSTAALARAYKDFLDPATLNKDSLFDASKSDRLTGEERAMLEALQKRGRIDLTQTMDLSGRASQDNLSRVAKQTGSIQSKITQMLGATFHIPEVANRQVTAIATYRLAKEGGASEGEATAKAEQAIVDTHFIYEAVNRPRYMSGNVLRVLTLFRQYSQNIAFLYGRSASVWLDSNNATPEERKIAKKQLLSMTALQFGAAGALGMPFIGTIASLVTAILNGFGDDDDKIDWEVELRKFLADQFGKEAGEVLSHGVSRLTPWDMAGRLGQADLFFRAPNREREGRAAAMDWLTSFAGPVLGYAVNGYLGVGDLAKGISQLDRGAFLRGTEELVPAVLRNAVKAIRHEVEGGVRTRDGYKQLDVNALEKIGTFFGFSGSRSAEMYESIGAIRNTEHRITVRRKELLDQYASAIQDRDKDARSDALAEIRSFNTKNPALRISGDTLLRSMKGRERRERDTKSGLYLPRKRESLRQQGDFANF